MTRRKQENNTSRPRRALALVLALCTALVLPAEAASLRFYGNGVNDVDRVKIRVNPQTPADIGSGDFTIEFWMKARPEDYIPQSPLRGSCTPAGNSWINGNIMFDRALWDDPTYGDYGISLFPNGIAFGITRAPFGTQTAFDGGLCGSTTVNDGAWHHIAITRDGATGSIALFVDGVLDAQGIGPDGNVSYRDGRQLSSNPSIPPNVNVAEVDPFLIIGAEKYSQEDRYPSFSGWIDEVRLSSVVRYTERFNRPTQPFVVDSDTVALYHFDEGQGAIVGDVLGASNGTLHFGTGGLRPAGPVWSAESPFGSTPLPGPGPGGGGGAGGGNAGAGGCAARLTERASLDLTLYALIGLGALCRACRSRRAARAAGREYPKSR